MVREYKLGILEAAVGTEGKERKEIALSLLKVKKALGPAVKLCLWLE